MTIARTKHMAISIGLFEKLDDKTLLEVFTSEGGPLTVQNIRQHLADLRAEGYQWMPCNCGNYDETGQCRGTVTGKGGTNQ